MSTPKSFIHYYSDCTSQEYYDDGQCRECKSKQLAEVKSIKKLTGQEKAAIKQRLMRRSKRVKDVTLDLKTDMELLGLNNKYLDDMDKMYELIQGICDIDLREYKRNRSTV